MAGQMRACGVVCPQTEEVLSGVKQGPLGMTVDLGI